MKETNDSSRIIAYGRKLETDHQSESYGSLANSKIFADFCRAVFYLLNNS